MVGVGIDEPLFVGANGEYPRLGCRPLPGSGWWRPDLAVVVFCLVVHHLAAFSDRMR